LTSPFFIIGAGGFGREVFTIIEALANDGSLPRPKGFIDDAPSAADLERVEVLGSQVVGAIDDLVRRTEPFSAVLAIGSASVRRRIAALLRPELVTFPTLIHPDTTIGGDVRIAEGVVVAAGSRLSTNISVGRHVHIDQNAAVGHDCLLGDFSCLNPQACVSGGVRVGCGVLVGANATVLQGLEVGDDAIVGAGAVVTRDVAPTATVVGIPARRVGDPT
jgi:sugar O-acyltransferase (sialic acid O-acetyltransferase NeuD family)